MDNDEKKQSPPTIMDVARESGVSYATVSRALNGYEFVKPSTREKVLLAAEKLGYVPNNQARSLAGGRSNLIGILAPALDNGYIAEIIRGIDEELAKSSYNLILYTTHRHHGKESNYVASIVNGVADGLLLIVPLIPTTYLDALRHQNFPHVLIDQSDFAEKSGVVNATNWQGAYDATQYLLQLGHQRIGFIGGMAELSSAIERLNGYRTALEDAQLPSLDELITVGDFTEAGGYAATQKLLNVPHRPTAIFASNDLSAFGAMEAIRQHGLRIPDDISVVGFDDIPQASIAHPKLTTVRQPLEQMGRVAVKMLLEQIEDQSRPPRRVTLATRLIVRDSCQSLHADNG
ncbi:MAG: LacI family DNA-binding transcriptional regulator [bacterium]|nr:LacI family DNA-binding transcriptional regulator [bacterium]